MSRGIKFNYDILDADEIIQHIEQSNAIKDKQIIVYYNYAVLNLIE